MAKKSLIVYASWTGNTEKVALRFKKVFEKMGWECDMFKVDHHTDVKNPPFNLDDYDFLCLGSPVINKKPVEEIISIMFKRPLGPSGGQPVEARIPPPPKEGEKLPPYRTADKVVFGPDSKKGVVFMTYGGIHLGPKEVEPAISLLSLVMEHMPFQCVGRFACPGKHGNAGGWFKDLIHRPNERDLLKAEIFMEETLEELD